MNTLRKHHGDAMEVSWKLELVGKSRGNSAELGNIVEIMWK